MLMLMHSRLVLRWTLGYAGIGRQPAPTEDHYSPQKGSRPTQPGSSSNFADGAPLLPFSFCHFSPPPDGGGCAAPDAPEGSKEWDFSSPTLPLRRRLAPHLLPALVTYRGCATSPRPLVIHEAELGNAAAPSRLDGVQVPAPPLHRHPHRLIPAKEKSC